MSYLLKKAHHSTEVQFQTLFGRGSNWQNYIHKEKDQDEKIDLREAFDDLR